MMLQEPESNLISVLQALAAKRKFDPNAYGIRLTEVLQSSFLYALSFLSLFSACCLSFCRFPLELHLLSRLFSLFSLSIVSLDVSLHIQAGPILMAGELQSTRIADLTEHELHLVNLTAVVEYDCLSCPDCVLMSV